MPTEMASPTKRKEEIAAEAAAEDVPSSKKAKTEDAASGDAAALVPLTEEEAEKELAKFLVKFPADFRAFFDFCRERNPQDPLGAIAETTGLRLVGPFQVLAGAAREMEGKEEADYLTHWRYYYDVPEFQTVLAHKDTQFHIGESLLLSFPSKKQSLEMWACNELVQ